MGAKHSQLTLWRSGPAGPGGREGGPAGGRGGVASLGNAGGAVPPPPPPHCPPQPGDPGGCCSEPAAGAAARSRCPGPPGAGRLMSWVEEAGEALHPLCARGQGAAGEAWERDGAGGSSGSPTYLLAARRGGLGPAARLPAPIPTLAKKRNTPHVSLVCLDSSNCHF